MSEKFVPTKTARFMPGAHMKPERAQALFGFAVDIDDLTVDDRMFIVSQTATGWLHGVLGLIVERWGKEAAKEVAYQFGRRIGSEALRGFMAAHNLTEMTPELFCRWQQTGHAMLGPSMAFSVGSYDDEKCELRRTQCLLYNPAVPEATRTLCMQIARGAMDAYEELSPNMECLLEEAMPKGDSFCHEIFRLKK